MNLNPEQLFLLEILVDTIVFGEGSVPQKKQVIVNCNLESIVKFEIRAEGTGAIEKEERDSKRRDMEFNIGKSYLFSCNPSDLMKALDNYPLEMSISTKSNPLPYGICLVDWGSDFTDMVQASSESYGYVTPAALYGLYNLRDSVGHPVGSMDLFIRLSCFGKNIQTNFQVIQNAGKDGNLGPRQFFFKYTNAGTTFKCERYGMGTSQEVLPVGPIYNSTDIEPVSQFKTLFSNLASRQSVMPFLDTDFMNRPETFDLSSFLLEVADAKSETMSICIRPNDIKLTNLYGLFKDGSLPLGVGQDESSSGSSLEELTADSINRRLCKNPNCPAAIKFKEYGLGPLATGKGLGCCPLAARTPYAYGLTHVNGKMDNYGPYGIYTRPKDAEQPFVPKQGKEKKNRTKRSASSECQAKATKKSSGTTDSCTSDCGNSRRLKGGQDATICVAATVPTVDCQVLRLRGGVSTERVTIVETGNGNRSNEAGTLKYRMDKEELDGLPWSLRLTGGGLYEDVPSPLRAVKDLMDDFDKVVDAYRRALGPCGQAVCPFARNVVEETCRKLCSGAAADAAAAKTPLDALVECDTCSANEDDGESITACGTATCPYGRLNTRSETEEEQRRRQPKSACGDVNCKFFKASLGFDEDAIDLDVLPKNCGAPTCKFWPKQDLPPIHWDCPEPLPKGACRNPNCPLLSQLAKCYEPRCVCDLPGCAYAMPPPCGNPACAFQEPRTCPYQTKQQETSNNCNVARPQTDNGCAVPTNKKCPYAVPVPPPPCPFENKPPSSVCGSPECPYSVPVKNCPFTATAKCGNPTCPYAQSLEPCPYAPPPVTCPAPRPRCPLVVCSDPSCPFQGVTCLDGDDCPLLRAAPSDEGDEDEPIVEPAECRCPPCLALQEEFCEECFRERQQEAQRLLTSLGISQKRPGEELTPCCSDTCQIKAGGTLECGKCVIKAKSEEETGTGAKKTKRAGKRQQRVVSRRGGTQQRFEAAVPKKRKRHPRKYAYDVGDEYPGVKIGHRECVDLAHRVPYNMGWMWHSYSSPCMGLKPRYGWKPGAIGYTIANIIKKHREARGLRMQFPPDPNKKKRKRRKGGGYSNYDGSESDESIPPKPTLQIKKKDGAYFITMNPLKDPYGIEDNENPYVDCTPMQFKITKNKRPKREADEEDAEERNGGDYKTCYCGQEDDKEKPKHVAESTTSDSELDIEFTPPAGIIRPERLKRKKTVVHTDTQYNTGDFQTKDKKGKGGKKGGKGKGKGKGKKGKKKGKK